MNFSFLSPRSPPSLLPVSPLNLHFCHFRSPVCIHPFENGFDKLVFEINHQHTFSRLRNGNVDPSCPDGTNQVRGQWRWVCPSHHSVEVYLFGFLRDLAALILNVSIWTERLRL